MIGVFVTSLVLLQDVPVDSASREVTVQRVSPTTGQSESAVSREVTIQRIAPNADAPGNIASREVNLLHDPNIFKGIESRLISVSMVTNFKLNLTFSGLPDQNLAPNSIGYELFEHAGPALISSGTSVRGGDELFPVSGTRRVYDVRCIVAAPFLNRRTTINASAGFAVFPVTIFTGDVDDSGEVDAIDIDAVIANFGSLEPIIEDLDLSQEVDALDIDIVIQFFGSIDE